ncbi:MAG: hypothetical protein V2B15_08805 [Bacteroidota bacterium]
MKRDINPDFCIEIDFNKNSENPSRIFQTMSDLIKSFQELDNDLIRGIDSKIEPTLLLEDIEAGSLRSWFTNKIKGIPDEALKTGDWKAILGHYLVKAKFIIINNLEGKTQITDAKIIEDIQSDLHREAQKTDVKSFPNYTPIQLPKLVSNIDRLNKSLKGLENNDGVIFKSGYGDASFNLELDFTAEEIEDLITKETIESTTEMILKVKKPDYLGLSMWDFKLGSKLISAKILHTDWLLDFQERKKDIRPGDSIRAMVRTTTKYGFNYELVGYSYEITEIKEIIPVTNPRKLNIDFGEAEETND